MREQRVIHSIALVGLSTMLSVPVWAAEHRVQIVTDYENLRMAFEPRSLVIQPGDTVVWVNELDEEHNVMTYPGGFPKGAQPFQSTYLQSAGEEFRQEFTAVGTYQYHCLPHLLMGMRGEIIVGRPSAADEFHEPSREELAAYRAELFEWFDEEDNLLEIRVSEKPGHAESLAHEHHDHSADHSHD